MASLSRLGARQIAYRWFVWYNGVAATCGERGENRSWLDVASLVGAQVEKRRRTVDESMGIQHWMVLALLFFMDIAVLGCLFLIAMNKVYLLP